jgi:acetyl esterase
MLYTPESSLELIAKTENREILGRHGPIKIRIFTPKIDETLPVILFFHRGGWVYGSIEECEGICRKLANVTKSIVIAVSYSLAPEHKFPVPLEDCYDATKWAVENAASFSGDSQKVMVCGESAGGNLAAAVALLARDTKQFSLIGQLLLYPVLTNELDVEAYENSPDKSLLSIENMQFFLEAYLSSPQEGENPYVSPVKSKDLSKLPPAFILTAEHDALKHEGALYAESLRKAGISTQLKCYPNVIHGFLDLPLEINVKKEAFEDIKVWLKTLISG